MTTIIPGLIIPHAIMNELEHSSNPLKTGVEIAARFIEDLKSIADGVHIMAVHGENQIPAILELARL